ncbi:FKBP-type peptidyl-prolyl cis-trans isomerase [Gryllotalpicola ginsengisoli]|uniref:FKBP-type peptidyl-prolyl cis-trans isomerase n=1 Tax=Gryllotalpicola ginsengisoli TaxID=444608 RepID=UPI000403DFA7|nr:FKBP-type peptidyl-prolyl cis-trans isomerase [Gryllotalpicola ginsengisoli]
MRRIAPLLSIAAVAALLLTACSGSGGSSDSSSSTSMPSASSAALSGCSVKSGAQSEAVTVSGDVGSAPKATVPAKLAAKTPQRTVVTTGDGAKAQTGRTLFGAFSFYDGTTGKEIDAEGYSGQAAFSFTAGSGEAVPVFDDLFGCVTEGSRVVLAETAKTAFGSSVDSTQFGVAETDTVVFIGDLLYVAPDLPSTAKANGKAQAAKSGFPAVKTASSGKPTVTIPKSAKAPTKTQVEVLKKGTGATVKSGDFVTVQYQGVNWRTGKVFDESWGRAVATFQTNAVVAGFTKGLVGQTVGSQVVTMMPPADGYGSSGNSDAGIKATDSLVFVIDILVTSHGAAG